MLQQGLQPHPRFSVSSALPVGMQAAEYADLEFREEISAGDIERLKSALPPIDIVQWRRSPAVLLQDEPGTGLPLDSSLLARDLNWYLERLQLMNCRFREILKGEKIIDIKPHTIPELTEGKWLEMLCLW